MEPQVEHGAVDVHCVPGVQLLQHPVQDDEGPRTTDTSTDTHTHTPKADFNQAHNQVKQQGELFLLVSEYLEYLNEDFYFCQRVCSCSDFFILRWLLIYPYMGRNSNQLHQLQNTELPQRPNATCEMFWDFQQQIER